MMSANKIKIKYQTGAKRARLINKALIQNGQGLEDVTTHLAKNKIQRELSL